MADFWYAGREHGRDLWFSTEYNSAVRRLSEMPSDEERYNALARGEMDPRQVADDIEEERRLRAQIDADPRSHPPTSSDEVIFSENEQAMIDSLGNGEHIPDTPEIQAQINELHEEVEAARATAARSSEAWSQSIREEDRETVIEAMQDALNQRRRSEEVREAEAHREREYWDRMSDQFIEDSENGEERRIFKSHDAFEKGHFMTLSSSANHPKVQAGDPLEVQAVSTPFLAVKNLFTDEVFSIDMSQFRHQIMRLTGEYVKVLMEGNPKKKKKPDDVSGRIGALEIT